MMKILGDRYVFVEEHIFQKDKCLQLHRSAVKIIDGMGYSNFLLV